LYSSLDRDAQYLKGVGPRRAKLLERLGVRTARDLLYHTPRRYEDASSVTPIRSLNTGMEATVIGRVVSKGILPTRKGLRIFQAVVRDRSALIECAWPGQPFLDQVIHRGDLLLLSGTVRFFHGQQLHPREFTILANQGEEASLDEGVVFPIYPATEGLPHRQLRQVIADNLDELLAAVTAEEVLPEELREATGVPPLHEALGILHRPAEVASVEAGRRRLALEELFFLQLIHARSRLEETRGRPGIRMPRRDTYVRQLYERLPFQLTGAQKRALREIGVDMASPFRMNRLLQGDVGSGKTVVALFAALRAVENGYQAALMAPTEILAEQHARTLSALLAGMEISVELLTGRMTTRARRPALERIASGTAHLVIGTHALIQEGVDFARLGLAIVDEQHRFGVRQRLALAERGENPDVLVMSGTPIPRSLALTLYGDLDVSILDERPPGRRRIRTAIRRPRDRPGVLEFVRTQIGEGRQAYLVYPLVEEGETSDLKAAADEFEQLRTGELADLRLELLHGQMPPDAKDRVMRDFAAGRIDALVATTVVEVGIDVPNATVMVIEHAERFGLSQLHQLRGRVGRGAAESYCILISAPGQGAERLRIFSRTEDGFRIAEADLRIRGQGDLFGSRQSGLPEFRWADLSRDLELLVAARDAARVIIDGDPRLNRHPALRQAMERRYAERLGLFQTG
jgi:ATP-dependent DNA helicase RecG